MDAVDFPDSIVAVTVLLVSEFIPALAYCRGPISATAKINVKFCDPCKEDNSWSSWQEPANIGESGELGLNVGTNSQVLPNVGSGEHGTADVDAGGPWSGGGNGKWGTNMRPNSNEEVGNLGATRQEGPSDVKGNSPQGSIVGASGEAVSGAKNGFQTNIGENRQGKGKVVQKEEGLGIKEASIIGESMVGASIQGFNMGARNQGVANVGESTQGGTHLGVNEKGETNLGVNRQGSTNFGGKRHEETNLVAREQGASNLEVGGQWLDNVRSSGQGVNIITKNGMDLEKKITVRRSDEDTDQAGAGLSVEEDPNYPILIGLVFVVTLIALSLIIGVIYFWCPEICSLCIRKSKRKDELNGTTKILTVKDTFGNIISEAKTVEVWKTRENKIKTYDILTREISGLKRSNKIGYKELEEDPDGSNFNSREESHKDLKNLPPEDGDIIIIRQPNNARNNSRLTYLEELDPRTLTPYQPAHFNHGRMFRVMHRPEPERRPSRHYLHVENPRTYRSVTPLDLLSVNGSEIENNLNFSRHYTNNSRAGPVILEVDPRERNYQHSYRNPESERDYRRDHRHWESRYDEMDSPRKSDVQILTVHANEDDSENSFRSLNVIPEENFSPRYQSNGTQYSSLENRGRKLQRSERKENNTQDHRQERVDRGVNTDRYNIRSKSLQDQRSPRRNSKELLKERRRSLQDQRRELRESPSKEPTKERTQCSTYQILL